MIDPDGIMLASTNKNTSLLVKEVPEVDYLVWDLEDDKEFKKYISTVEKEIRGSYEYRAMINYLKEYCNMNECAFLKVGGEDNHTVKIEIHHYPFTLFDIVEIIYRKRQYYGESLELQMLAKECTMVHYKLLVGLIPLSKTVHQLYHDNKLFIPVDNVFGRYKKFVELYGQFCTPEQLETLNRIEKYSIEKTNDVHDTTVLDTNMIHYNVKNDNFTLPPIPILESKMNEQIQLIKKNNYRLPTLEDMKDINRTDSVEDRHSKQIIKPIEFF